MDPSFGAVDYVAHMLYCYRTQDNAEEVGSRWWALAESARKPWREKALKKIREWRAAERHTQTMDQREISFRRADSATSPCEE